MPNPAFKENIQDYALAHLLIDVATIDLQKLGAPVSDEELSVFVEAEAKASLGQQRCEQIVAHLCRDEHLYQRWLILFQSKTLDGDFPPAVSTIQSRQSKHSLTLSSLVDWLQPFFVPRFGFGAVLGVMIVAFWGAYMAIRPTHDGGLVSHTGDTLPERASYGDVKSNQTTESSTSATTIIGSSLQCIAMGQKGNICYSNTREQQHWFITVDGAVNAVEPPVSASKIISVRTQADKALIEYRDSVNARLTLLHVNLTSDGWQTKTLYEDVVAVGYFDGLQLSPTTLSYEKRIPDKPIEKVRYPLDQP